MGLLTFPSPPDVPGGADWRYILREKHSVFHAAGARLSHHRRRRGRQERLVNVSSCYQVQNCPSAEILSGLDGSVRAGPRLLHHFPDNASNVDYETEMDIKWPGPGGASLRRRRWEKGRA